MAQPHHYVDEAPDNTIECFMIALLFKVHDALQFIVLTI